MTLRCSYAALIFDRNLASGALPWFKRGLRVLLGRLRHQALSWTVISSV